MHLLLDYTISVYIMTLYECIAHARTRIGNQVRFNWIKQRIPRTCTHTHQICREIDEVCVVFVDELHHGALERAVVCVQVVSQALDGHSFPALVYKVVDGKVLLQEDVRREA